MGFALGQLLEDGGRPSPLVLHHELTDDRALLVGHGGDDHPEDDLPGHHQVQRARHGRGGGGGDRLEAGPRRRVPQARARGAPGGVRRHRGAGVRHVRADDVLRCPRHLVAGAQGGPAAVDDAPVHLHGRACGLRLGAAVQDHGRREDQVGDGLDGRLLPGDLLRHLLRAQPLHLGGEVLRSGALHHDVRHPCVVVRHLRAPGALRLLRRVPRGGDRAAGGHQVGAQADPGAALVRAAHPELADRRRAALRGRVHGAVLHHVLHVAASVLLPVRFPRTGLGDPSRDVCRDCHRADLLPADSGGLQVVVALLLC
mmetsp:Transcript_47562/g.122876  ORF Transcript_47562/g.122876 Transcript_47562/m.122876 type:complete len:313 (-) Transcript_47562:304-1242(-)